MTKTLNFNSQKNHSVVRQMCKAFGSIAIAAALTACGGGGGSGGGSDTAVAPAASKPEGAYRGTVSDGSSFNLLALENNQVFGLIGVVDSTGVFRVGGLIEGTGAVSGSSFSVVDAREFLFNGQAFSGTVSSSFTPKTSISGSANFNNQVVSFTGTAVPSTEYNYDAAVSISQVSGNWSGGSLNGEGINFSVSGAGAVSGVSSLGCTFTGTVAPRASGKAVFDVMVRFGAAPCVAAGVSARGIALSTTLSSGRQQLLIAVVDPTRTLGTVVFANR